MDHLISKAWSSQKLLGIAERVIMVSVFLVIVIAIVRMLGIVR